MPATVEAKSTRLITRASAAAVWTGAGRSGGSGPNGAARSPQHGRNKKAIKQVMASHKEASLTHRPLAHPRLGTDLAGCTGNDQNRFRILLRPAHPKRVADGLPKRGTGTVPGAYRLVVVCR
ncbi:hypothetical protein GCM10022251_19830 [Phytohabitans flavus]|uniref:Uncharacterized protein n=1 Tax=Phytohabitans flavus TaxID=1076124 RepID=A0A6F8XZK8_9ACTN|nr:hypothetical protein [Phytohabitans flavus]BCB79158.1 hypothetical protein Pflav_055680 [Phytohabitans flavus]